MTELRRGDVCRVRKNHQDEWTQAVVALASDTDPSSVMLTFDGAVRDGRGGFVAKCLPLTIDYKAQSVISLFGDTYEIEVGP